MGTVRGSLDSEIGFGFFITGLHPLGQRWRCPLLIWVVNILSLWLTTLIPLTALPETTWRVSLPMSRPRLANIAICIDRSRPSNLHKLTLVNARHIHSYTGQHRGKNLLALDVQFLTLPLVTNGATNDGSWSTTHNCRSLVLLRCRALTSLCCRLPLFLG